MANRVFFFLISLRAYLGGVRRRHGLRSLRLSAGSAFFSSYPASETPAAAAAVNAKKVAYTYLRLYRYIGVLLLLTGFSLSLSFV